MPKNDDSSFREHGTPQNNDSQVEIYAKPKKQMTYEKGSGKGKWSNLEKMQYLTFFQFLFHKQFFTKGKKMKMVFKMMSAYIKTRNLLQCRSHHQKMIQKFGPLKNIVKSAREQVKEQEFQTFVEENYLIIEQIYQQFRQRRLINIEEDNPEPQILQAQDKEIAQRRSREVPQQIIRPQVNNSDPPLALAYTPIYQAPNYCYMPVYYYYQMN